MQNERLSSSGLFGEWITGDDGSTVFFMEQWAYEYCPELDYVFIAGGHGYVSAYDLVSLEEIFINPSTYVYSPSGRYRIGTFYGNEMFYIYVGVREADGYATYLISSGYAKEDAISGHYWADENTIHYLTKHLRNDDSVYHIGRLMRFEPKLAYVVP